jgi:hypothetical protein
MEGSPVPIQGYCAPSVDREGEKPIATVILEDSTEIIGRAEKISPGSQYL